MKPGFINTAKMTSDQIKPLIEWLRKNGIDPELMPRHQAIVSTGNRITYEVVKYRQDPYGGKQPVIGGDDFFARETKTTRIRVPFEPSK